MSVPQAAKTFSGVIVPMGSPFTMDGRIDRDAVHRVVSHLIKGGVHGVFILGTMGEGLSVPVQERVKLVSATAEALTSLGSNAPFYVNISGICLRDSIDESKRFLDASNGRISTFVAHPPFYYPIGPAEIRRYYDVLVESVPGPLMLYNIPQTTKVSIPIDVVKAFADHPKVVGMKDSDGDRERVLQMLESTGPRDDFSFVIGSGLLATEGIQRGAAGMVVSGANLAPVLWAQWWRTAMEARAGKGDWGRVKELQGELDAVAASYMSKGLLGQCIAAMKNLMAKQGLCTNMVLPPLVPDNS
ncbi:MAG: dihydrodipicolinate synthase family protein [Phycisphaerae bacterium]